MGEYLVAKRTVKPIKAPSQEAVYAAATMIRMMPAWVQTFKPLLDAAARNVKADRTIALGVPEALDGFGRYCRLLGKEIREAQEKTAQAAIAPLPASNVHAAPEPARSISPRRVGSTPASSRPVLEKARKPARSA